MRAQRSLRSLAKRASAWPPVRIARATLLDFKEDKCPRLSAALAYYTAFSILPFLVLAIGVLGLALGGARAERVVVGSFEELVGRDGATTLGAMVHATGVQSNNLVAAAFGLGALVLGAAGVFGQLHDALNTVWEVEPKKGRGIWGVLRDRFLSYGMVFGLAFLFVVSLLLSAGVAAIVRTIAGPTSWGDSALLLAEVLLSIPVLTLLFVLLFKGVPDARIRWRDAALGAFATAVLLTLGKFLVGLYIGHKATSSRYGPAAAIVLLLLWVYYAGLIVMLGAEFTQVYAHQEGSGIRPDRTARPLPNAERHRQGMKGGKRAPQS